MTNSPETLTNSKEWLSENKNLRMDANNEIFNKERREFHLDRYLFAQPFCTDKTVLDGACGTGYGTDILGKNAKFAIGIDIAADAINYANTKYANKNITFQQSPVELTPFEDSSFDIVVSFETVEHTLCPSSHIMEIARLLKPKTGKAILSVPNNWGLTDHHFFDFNLLLFKEILEPFFSEIEYFYQIPRNKAINIQHIAPLYNINENKAQCIIAVCSNAKKSNINQDRFLNTMEEIYKNAFIRHNDYRTLLYRQNTSLSKRIFLKLRKTFNL